MASLRDHFGSRCPACRNDILQQAPSANRMPGQDLAWCPSCDRRFALGDLQRAARPGPAGLLRRLFGGGAPQ